MYMCVSCYITNKEVIDLKGSVMNMKRIGGVGNENGANTVLGTKFSKNKNLNKCLKQKRHQLYIPTNRISRIIGQ